MSKRSLSIERLGCVQSSCAGSAVGGCGGCLLPIGIFMVLLVVNPTGDAGGILFWPISMLITGAFGAVAGAILSLIARGVYNRLNEQSGDDDVPPIAAP